MSPNRVQHDAYGREGYVQVVFVEECEGYLVVHPRHGQSEWEKNKNIGRLLAASGEAIVLLPNIDDTTTADALRNGEEWEFKTIKAHNLKNVIQNALRKGKFQSPNVLVFVDMLYTIEDITLGIHNAVKFDHHVRLQKIAVLFRNGSLIEMSRSAVRQGLHNAFFR